MEAEPYKGNARVTWKPVWLGSGLHDSWQAQVSSLWMVLLNFWSLQRGSQCWQGAFKFAPPSPLMLITAAEQSWSRLGGQFSVPCVSFVKYWRKCPTFHLWACRKLLYLKRRRVITHMWWLSTQYIAPTLTCYGNELESFSLKLVRKEWQAIVAQG